MWLRRPRDLHRRVPAGPGSARARSAAAFPAVLLASALALVTIGCSGGDADDDDRTGASVADGPAASSTRAAGTAAGGDTGPAGETAATTDRATDPVSTDPPPSVATVPDTGVPGLDSADAFCRSWSEFAGSFQALALATSLGTDPAAAARLEVAAAPAILAAIKGLDANLPEQIEAEREALVSELAGPMSRRAARARDELLDAGLAQPAIVTLGEAWLGALAAAGLEDPDIDLDVPAAVDPAAFDAAVDEFVAALPPIDQDPSLITDASIPLTERYLVDNCPDQGTLGGNDIIDEI